MVNNLFLGPDGQARFLLQSLQACETSGKISDPTTRIIEGIQLSSDPEARVAGEFSSPVGEILRLKAAPRGGTHARWQALHVTLGPADISGAGALGVMIRSRAPSSMTTRICLRSGREGGFVDHFLPKTLISFAQDSTHLDVIELSQAPDLPRQADWRDLILFFRPGPVELELRDLRLFIL